MDLGSLWPFWVAASIVVFYLLSLRGQRATGSVVLGVFLGTVLLMFAFMGVVQSFIKK